MVTYVTSSVTCHFQDWRSMFTVGSDHLSHELNSGAGLRLLLQMKLKKILCGPNRSEKYPKFMSNNNKFVNRYLDIRWKRLTKQCIGIYGTRMPVNCIHIINNNFLINHKEYRTMTTKDRSHLRRWRHKKYVNITKTRQQSKPSARDKSAYRLDQEFTGPMFVWRR